MGSIVINFDPEVKTNVITRDFRCPNLRYFSYKGVGTYAYQKQYEPTIDLRKGDELGAFNLGSTVVLFFEVRDIFFGFGLLSYYLMGDDRRQDSSGV